MTPWPLALAAALGLHAVAASAQAPGHATRSAPASSAECDYKYNKLITNKCILTTSSAAAPAAGDPGGGLAAGTQALATPFALAPALKLDTHLSATPAAGQRRRPGESAVERPAAATEPLPDPNRRSRLLPVSPPDQARAGMAPVPDRWRILNSLGLVPAQVLDPYRQNLLKGDQPIAGDDRFLSLSLISDTVYEPRRLPTPVGPQATTRAGAVDIFGGGAQSLFSQSLIVSLVYLRGDTSFRPPDYEYHFTPVFNFNDTHADEDRALAIDPAAGRVRSDRHLGVQELFADYHLRNVSERYDFDSLRVGIQPLTADFRGFLFQDNPLALRLFGTRAGNRVQYNLALFRRLEKDTNSGLNDLGAALRHDDTLLANLYVQDLPVTGYTSQLLLAHNRNREDGARYYDRNGFLARPASIGTEFPRRYHVTYLGYNGDGHIGRLNLTVSGYLAAGRESRGVFLDQPRDILAGFAAAELSRDFDWLRLRLSALYASGDRDPYGTRAGGFDAIFENPLFAGADTSFWIRQGVPLIGGGGVALSTRNGVLNNLRSSKEHGQSNFDNPGTVLLGAGADLDLLPELRLSANANALRFDDTAVLETARNQGGIARDLGWDLSTALIWRPLMSQNLVLRLSAARLLPGRGYRDLFPDQQPYSALANLILAY